MRILTFIILSGKLTAFSLFGYGCAAPPDASQPQGSSSQQSSEPAATYVDARPAALVDGRGVMWGDLRVPLSEAAGGQVLRDLITDRAVARAAENAGIEIVPQDLQAERQLLLQTLSDDPDMALRLLDELRRHQGLGPARFNALMQRNAKLRALVRDSIEVTESAVTRMFETTHGPKRQARLMMLPTLGTAQRALERIEAGEFFGEVATSLSTDASAARGGLLEPISRADGSYPEVLRQALWDLSEGEISRPILLHDQYALLMLVDETEADDVELADVREDMQRRVRLQRERAAMDRLARELVQNVSVTVFDNALEASWLMMRRSNR